MLRQVALLWQPWTVVHSSMSENLKDKRSRVVINLNFTIQKSQCEQTHGTRGVWVRRSRGYTLSQTRAAFPTRERSKFHGDLRRVVSRGPWLSPRAFARAGYGNQDWLRCIARPGPCSLSARYGRCYSDVSKAFIVWALRDTSGRYMVGCVGSHVRNLTTSYFDWKETKFVGNKTAIYSRNRSSLCLFFVKLTLLCVFSSFIRPITCPRASREHAFRQAVTPSPSHYRDGSEKVRTFDKRTHHHKRFDRQRSVSVLWLRHAQLRDLVEVWALTGECSPPCSSRVLAARSEPVCLFHLNLCWFRSKFAWGLPLSLSSPWTMIFFSETTNTDKKWKLVSNARLPQ